MSPWRAAILYLRLLTIRKKRVRRRCGETLDCHNRTGYCLMLSPAHRIPGNMFHLERFLRKLAAAERPQKNPHLDVPVARLHLVLALAVGPGGGRLEGLAEHYIVQLLHHLRQPLLLLFK